MSAPPFERLGIIGLGLVGGSVALAAKRRWPSIAITVCDPAPVTREAVAQGLVSAVVATPGELAACDLIVIATPVQTVPGVLAQLTAAGTTALVTDTGSTKRVVMQAAQTTTLTFVGGHPVAGAETSGLGAARADLFDGRPWLLVSASPEAARDPAVFPGVLEAMLATFVVGLGARPEWTDAVTHDRVMAHVSHAPQVVSTALMAASGAAVGPDGVAWSGKGFADMTRLAASAPDVWQGILDTNADFIADALGAITAKLPTSAEALTDTPVVRALFERARAEIAHIHGQVMPPLWTPSAARVAGSNLTRFVSWLEAREGRAFSDYAALHRWSITERGRFWSAVWDFGGVIGTPGGAGVLDADRMPGARFFPEARLNFAENLLRRRDDTLAIIAVDETGAERRLTTRDLYDQVSRCAQALGAAGVGPGDRVAGFMANVPEAIIAALAAASLGAVWSSCSPDFGVQGVLDRFGQIEPTVLVAVAGYHYGGKYHDCRARLQEIAAHLPTLKQVVLIEDPGTQDSGPGTRNPGLGTQDSGPRTRDSNWTDFLAPYAPASIDFVPVQFNHPLYILYSSGTTGVPKCIEHGHGGTLLQHLKEHQLHTDVKPGDRVFYFTTCGWMMWNWLVSALASGATLVLYDGSPFAPDGTRLFDLAARLRITLFGTSAKFIDAVRKAGLRPIDTHDLASIRTITSTGSPLSPESFDFVYAGITQDVHLASISGGTDIVSCFVGGQPNAPVWRGEIQAAALGMAVEVWDDTGRPVRDTPGELVCTAPFPSMPIGFWNDPDGRKYHAAYFDRFPGVWCHGDWMERTAHEGFIIHGRSDATLNPGGVRIGTSEIYRQVEQLPEVVESLAIGQHWDGDERVVLFVRLRDGLVLDEALRGAIATRIRANTSPRHVPAKIVQVSDLPRTKSGKLVELAVRHVIHGRPVTNREALANPEALELFRDLPELGSQ